MGVRYRDYQYVGSLYDVDQSIGETSKQATAQRRAQWMPAARKSPDPVNRGNRFQ